jgi:hypothetical protein
METRPGQWSTDELLRQVRARHWSALTHPFSTREGIEIAASTMVATGEAERVRPGVIRYLALEEAQAPQEEAKYAALSVSR